MKITLCGSIAFIDEMNELKAQLEKLDHEVKLPPSEVVGENGQPMPVKEYYATRKATNETTGWIWDRKEEAKCIQSLKYLTKKKFWGLGQL